MYHLIPEIARLCQHVTLGLANWHEPLDRLALLTGSARAQLIGVGGPQVTPFNHVSGEADDAFDNLIAIDGYRPDVNFRIAASLGAAEMEVIDETHYAAVRPALSSDIYLDYCEQIGIPLGCQTKLHARHDRLIGLATLRTRADGATTPEQRALFAAAAPLIRSAVATQIQIEQQGKALMLGALEAVAARVILIDGYGRICGMTPAAEAVLASGLHLTMRDARLAGASRQGEQRIDAALAQTLSRAAPAEGLDIVLPPSAPGSSRLLVSIKSLQPAAASLGIQPRAIVIIGGGLLAGGDGIPRLRGAFDLTEAEAQVAMALAQGRPRAEIAALRGVTIETLRSQIKAVFRKAGVERERELIALILGG